MARHAVRTHDGSRCRLPPAAYLQELEAELRGEGNAVLAVPTDVADRRQVRRGFSTVREELGPVEILVNHASAAGWTEFTRVQPEEFETA